MNELEKVKKILRELFFASRAFPPNTSVDTEAKFDDLAHQICALFPEYEEVPLEGLTEEEQQAEIIKRGDMSPFSSPELNTFKLGMIIGSRAAISKIQQGGKLYRMKK